MQNSMRLCVLFRPEAIACVGYAFLLLASQMTLWGGLPLSESTGLDLSQLLFWWSVPLCASVALALLAIASFASSRFFICKKHLAMVLSYVGHAIVLVAYCLVLFGPEGSVSSTCVASVATGLGIGMASAAWLDVFARFDKESVLLLVIRALVLSAVLHLVANALFPRFLVVVFMFALLLAALCFAVALHGLRASGSFFSSGRQGDVAGESMVQVLKIALGTVRGPLYCAASIAFSVAITRMLTLVSSPSSSTVVNDFGLVAVVAGSAMLLLARKRFKGFLSDRLSIPALFGILFPVVATLLLALSIGGSPLGLPVGAAVFAVYSLVSALMVPVCIEGAKSQSIPPIAAYGVFAGLVHLSFAAATLLGTELLGGSATDRTLFLTCILIVLYVLAMAFAMIQRQASAKRNSSDDSQAISSDGSGGGRELARDVPEGAADPIGLRCAIVSERYALSPRESEVLFAFAHGRNVAYLAERLVLSENTIRSHSKTLYTKLGVHSKQELLDLVESIDLVRD